MDFDNDIIKVKGNFQDQVYTTRRYLQLIYNYNQVSRGINEKIKVYNLSNGAYLEGMQPLKIEDIEVQKFKKLNKKKLHEQGIKLFDKNSKKNLDKKDKKELLKEHKITNRLLVNLENKKAVSDFNKIFYQLMLKYPSSFIIQVINLYFDLLNPYINLLQESKDIGQRKVNMLQLRQIRKVLEFYKCKISKKSP